MYFTYVLYSPASDKIYIGFTGNLQERLKSHNQLSKKGWTVKFRPWILIYSETFDCKTSAMKREKELKSYLGRVFIRNLLNNK